MTDQSTWHDQRPSHPMTPADVRIPRERVIEAWYNYDQAVNAMQQAGRFDYDELERLGDIAEQLEREADAIYNRHWSDDPKMYRMQA